MKKKYKVPQLHKQLQYQNEAVLKRYMKDYGCSKAYATKQFTELLKFFWLGQKALQQKNSIKIAIYPSMIAIDHMWHTFLLFTQDYAQFCQKYFLRFIHHYPNTHDHRHAAQDPATQTAQFEGFLSYVYDVLGAETLSYWFRETPIKNKK